MNGQVIQGDCLEVLKTLSDNSVDCCITSPPYYGLRDYGVDGQIGLEDTPKEYIQKLVEVFREVKRVLKKEGTLWLNIGDSYCGTGSKGDYKDPKYSDGRNGQAVSLTQKIEGYKQKDLIGIPWMLAFALREDGWYLRQDIVWAKPNPMPEPVQDRCTKSHEYIFLLSKSPKYYFDHEAIQEDSVSNVGNEWHPTEKRNKRDVWMIPVQPTKEAHFATYPEKLVEPCLLAGCPEGGIVLDPFFGSGTTGRVATRFGRNYIGIELNPEYIEIINKRTSNVQGKLF